MSTVGTNSTVSKHQILSYEESDNSRVLGRTINRSKVYPLEESTHSGLIPIHLYCNVCLLKCYCHYCSFIEFKESYFPYLFEHFFFEIPFHYFLMIS